MTFKPGCSPRRPAAALLLLLAGCSSFGHRREEISTAAYAVAFTHGVLAFEEGDDRAAAELFAEAAHRDPREGTARHWLGLTLLRLGRLEEAIAQLEMSLRAERPPAAGRDRVLADLAAARQQLQAPDRIPGAGAAVAPGGLELALPVPFLPRWEGRIGADAGRDSNPGLLPDGLPFTIFGLTPAKADETARLDGRVEVHPFYDRHGWTLGLSAAGSRSFHQDRHDLDLADARGTVSLAWGRDPQGYLAGPLGFTRVPPGAGRFSLLLQGSGAGFWIGGAPYARLVESAASLLARESARWVTRIDLQAQARRYPGSRRADLLVDGSEVWLGISQTLYLGRADRYVRLGLAGGQRGGGLIADASLRKATGEAAVPLSARWSLLLFGSRGEEKFAHPESGLRGEAGQARDDVLWQAGAAALWKTTERTQWTLRVIRTRRDSNVEIPNPPSPAIDLFDYRRTVVAAGFNWFF